MPVVGDTVLESDVAKQPGEGEDESNQSAKKPKIASILLWQDRKKIFENEELQRGCLILPDFVPDSLIQLTLTPEAIEQLVQTLTEHVKNLSTLDFPRTLQVIYITKLLIL